MHIDAEYMRRLNGAMKVLETDCSVWSVEEVVRFSCLLKIDLGTMLSEYAVNGSRLFDPQYSINLQGAITLSTCLPLYKLLLIVQNLQRIPNPPPSPPRMLPPLQLSSQLITKITAQLISLDDIPVADISTNQLQRILKPLLPTHSDLCKKVNIDGFSLLYIIPQLHLISKLKNFFSQEDIKEMQYLSTIFVVQSVRQKWIESNNENVSIRKVELEREDDNTLGRKSMAESIGMSEVIRNSEDLGSSYPRGSIGVSLSMASSQIMTSPLQNSILRVSTMEDHNTIQQLRQTALSLPFCLLDTQPLKCLKITSLECPIDFKGDKLVQKEIFIFHSFGMTFGRSPQNTFCYPDQMSISSHHAKILFKQQGYFLKDLGSKTGTFLRIPPSKPFLITDSTLLQFSFGVEVKVRLLRNDPNEGVIKMQFNIPADEPAYRVTIKEKGVIRIGKAEGNHIKLAHASASTKHAEICYEDGRFTLTDCQSRGGTWLRLSPRGIPGPDHRIEKGNIFRISNKKIFLVEDMTTTKLCKHSTLKQYTFVGEEQRW